MFENAAAGNHLGWTLYTFNGRVMILLVGDCRGRIGRRLNALRFERSIYRRPELFDWSCSGWKPLTIDKELWSSFDSQ